MDFNLNHTLDSIKEGTKEIAETAENKTSEFHENYVSKVLPDCGKYGDTAKFAAEMVPGVSEYNAIREGDWQAFATSAGIDVAAVAVGAFSVGAGYAVVKGGSVAAKTGTKIAVKEVAEAGAEKVAKEVVEEGAEKAAKEVVATGAEKAAKEIAEEGSEIAVKEVDETAQIVKNKLDGTKREEKVLACLGEKYGDNNVIREALLRDSTGTPIRDFVTNEARRIDAVVIDGQKVIRSIEVTSETAPKGLQRAKELRILEQAKDLGGAFIKNPETGELIKFGEDIATEVVRLK